MNTFKTFINNIIVEAVHPELRAIIEHPTLSNKKALVVNKIKELSERGEPTGVESNMPRGSSRAYIKHTEPTQVEIDGQQHSIPFGTKIAIRSNLDRFHNKEKHDGMSLGQLQNEAENGDSYTNNYRVLNSHPINPKTYKTNTDRGIYPPLLAHDNNNHQWSDVGHVDNITKNQFQKLTKTPEFPKGITHDDFNSVLFRYHQRSNGKYWEDSKERESHLDKLEEHPLVEKFINAHTDLGHPPTDYEQIQNLGVWKHPNGSQHIVARDHGYSSTVQEAYHYAAMNERAHGQNFDLDKWYREK